jgi:uncharacterized membrane protein YdbT with pleckstrin-like domain
MSAYDHDLDDEEVTRPPRRRQQQRRGRRPPERVEWEGHPVWQGMIGWYFKRLLTVTVIIAILYALSRADVIGVYWVVLAAVVMYGGTLWVGRLIRRTTTYRLTNRSIYESFGIISTTSDQARLEEITTTRIEQSLIERMFRIGTINFDTAGEQLGNEDRHVWNAVRNPARVRELAERLRDDEDPFDFDADPRLREEDPHF